MLSPPQADEEGASGTMEQHAAPPTPEAFELPPGWTVEAKAEGSRSTRGGDLYVSPSGKRYSSLDEVSWRVMCCVCDCALLG